MGLCMIKLNFFFTKDRIRGKWKQIIDNRSSGFASKQDVSAECCPSILLTFITISYRIPDFLRSIEKRAASISRCWRAQKPSSIWNRFAQSLTTPCKGWIPSTQFPFYLLACRNNVRQVCIYRASLIRCHYLKIADYLKFKIDSFLKCQGRSSFVVAFQFQHSLHFQLPNIIYFRN